MLQKCEPLKELDAQQLTALCNALQMVRFAQGQTVVRPGAVDAPAERVGHRAMAVALSDLAAMGAVPAQVLVDRGDDNLSAQLLEELCRVSLLVIVARLG